MENPPDWLEEIPPAEEIDSRNLTPSELRELKPKVTGCEVARFPSEEANVAVEDLQRDWQNEHGDK